MQGEERASPHAPRGAPRSSPGACPVDRVVVLSAKGYALDPGVLLGRGFHLYQLSRVAPREPVLDIGCGDGVFGNLLLELLRERERNRPPFAVGLDVNPGALRRASGAGAYRFAIRASGERLPFRDAAFSTVIGNCVFEHIPNLREAVSEVARVLRPGGIFIITVPNDRYVCSVPGYRVANAISPGLAARLGAWYNRVGEQRHTLSGSAWHSILEETGLTPRMMIPYRSPRANRRQILFHYLFFYGRCEALLYALGKAFDFLGAGTRFRDALERAERRWLARDFRELETERQDGEAAELYIVAAKEGAST